ncbi:MAG TPA: hypothetical protein VFM56_03040, partial [Solimonas sp.]|nr:hypothetical protein [Solimonas sp.]
MNDALDSRFRGNDRENSLHRSHLLQKVKTDLQCSRFIGSASGPIIAARFSDRSFSMSLKLPAGMQINAPIEARFDEILTPEALEFVAKLHRAFEPRRQELLKKRIERQKRIDAGELPDFLPETKHIREGDWKVAPLPKALENRRVEITGPVERKMIINAFNSGADSYMTDFEDSNSPNWFNQIQGQVNLKDAIRRRISFTNEKGKEYKLNDKIATLQIRPR